jgi:hypothetical protein
MKPDGSCDIYVWYKTSHGKGKTIIGIDDQSSSAHLGWMSLVFSSAHYANELEAGETCHST